MTIQFETQTVTAEVRLADGQSINCSLFMQRSPLHPDGLERPLEMLNREEAFFAVSLASGEIVLVPKAQVAFVSCETPAGLDDVERQQVAKVLKLHVALSGGTEFRGSTVVELPPGHSRALDFLNTPEPFFSLDTGPATIYVNKSHIRFVSNPLD
jgi:hypothetical protein